LITLYVPIDVELKISFELLTYYSLRYGAAPVCCNCVWGRRGCCCHHSRESRRDTTLGNALTPFIASTFVKFFIQFSNTILKIIEKMAQKEEEKEEKDISCADV
jgi:hypothetical protein